MSLRSRFALAFALVGAVVATLVGVLSYGAASDRVTAEIDRSPAQVAINWVRQQRGLIIPIVGARTAAHLTDNLACLEFELTSDQLQRLDAATAIAPGFPHDFLASDHVRGLIFGDTFPLIDNHRS